MLLNHTNCYLFQHAKQWSPDRCPVMNTSSNTGLFFMVLFIKRHILTNGPAQKHVPPIWTLTEDVSQILTSDGGGLTDARMWHFVCYILAPVTPILSHVRTCDTSRSLDMLHFHTVIYWRGFCGYCIYKIMPSETDVAPKAISGRMGLDWMVGNLWAGLC